MQFLKTAFWVVIAMIIMLFSVTNWTAVTINLWGGIQLVTKLPVIVIIAFLAGAVPMWLLHKATRWRMRRKLDSAERALASVTPAYPPAPAPASTPTPLPTSAPNEPTDISQGHI